MIPLRQTIPEKTKPYVNRAIVGANVVIFLIQLFSGSTAEVLISIFGFMPARLLDPAAFHYAVWEAALTLVTSLFLHGGLVHLFGNMIYLWVFGGAAEDALGHVKYFFFFILAGVFGSLTHTFLLPHSTVPSIGASGSIAGVLGAFLVLRPKARIVTLFPLVIYWAMVEIPSVVFIPVWFLMQFANGFMSLASARGTQEVAGIAWWAHVGGFLFGVAVGTFWRMAQKRTASPAISQE
jgi:membrane associated rhomboid family serine protease